MFTRICAVVLLLVVPLSAQTGKEEIKSKDAIAVLDKYSGEYAKISKEYKLRHVALLKELIAELNPARAAAIGAGNLDEATAILLKIKEAEKLIEQDQVVELKTPEKPVRFEIIGAYWGAQESWIDVTKEVRSLVRLGRLVMDQPEKMGFRDPKVGTIKNLVVVFTMEGTPRSAIYNYNQRVQLPR